MMKPAARAAFIFILHDGMLYDEMKAMHDYYF